MKIVNGEWAMVNRSSRYGDSRQTAAIVTLSFQTIKAAVANPVKSLRSE